LNFALKLFNGWLWIKFLKICHLEVE
jgi:hypothetical protein